MKLTKGIKRAAVILFTTMLMLNSVTAEASDLKLNIELETVDNDYSGFEKSGDGGSIVIQSIEPIDYGPGNNGHQFKAGHVEIVGGTCIKAGTKTTYCAVSGCKLQKYNHWDETSRIMWAGTR